MATKGSPLEGFDNIVGPRVYTPTLTLRCYVNTLDSLSDATVFADIVEPTGGGYAPITLNGTWTWTDGVGLYDHGTPDDPQFENTNAEGGANWSQAVTGIWMTDGTSVLHFMDLSDGAVTMTPGKKLRADISNLVA